MSKAKAKNAFTPKRNLYRAFFNAKVSDYEFTGI